MKPARLVLCILACAARVSAHRVDEYLQAATIAVAPAGITVAMRLGPGLEVSSDVLAMMDRNADGVIAGPEESAYIDQLLRDLSLSLNGESLPLRVVSRSFPGIAELRGGLGEIQVEFFAPIGSPRQGDQALQFENRHFAKIGAYLVNALAPADAAIVIAAQGRNFTQSSYRLEYSRAGSFLGPSTNPRTFLFGLALVLTARLIFVWRRRVRARVVPFYGSE